MLKKETKDLILSQFAIGDSRKKEVEKIFDDIEFELRYQDKLINDLKNEIMDKREELIELEEEHKKEMKLLKYIHSKKGKENDK